MSKIAVKQPNRWKHVGIDHQSTANRDADGHPQYMIGPRPVDPDDDGKILVAEGGTYVLQMQVAPPAIPVGSVVAYTSSGSLPAGWLVCDGSAVSRTTYPDLNALAAAMSYAAPFGSGNGSTTFNVPDYRGRTLIGVGQGTGLTNRALGATGGEESHLLTSAETYLPSHTHGIQTYISTGGSTTGVVRTSTGSSASTIQTFQSDITCSAHNNMQPFSAARWMIHAGTVS